jgi:chromosome partitioning protein
MIVVAVINLKGGSAKTTSAAYLLNAFHEAGQRVLGVDADGENQHLVKWQAGADWPFPVVSLPVHNIHKQLSGITGDRYDVVVIDTPPMEAQRGTVLSSVRGATHVVVTMAPTGIEHERMGPVRVLLNDAADLRADGKPPVTVVLLNRTSPTSSSRTAFRDLLVDDGWTVLEAEVTRKETYAQSYGDPIKSAASTPYGDAALELLEMTP